MTWFLQYHEQPSKVYYMCSERTLAHVQNNAFWIRFLKICNPLDCVSFDTFRVRIGQLSNDYWVFEEYMQISISSFSKK